MIENLDCIDVLPLKKGVSPSKLYLPVGVNTKTVFDYLCVKFTRIDSVVWQERFLQKEIFASHNGRFAILTQESLYQDFQDGYIYYYRYVKQEAVVPFEHQVVFENERFMVVDKPHFLTMTPVGCYVEQTLLSRLKNKTNNCQLSPMHRLDKETAGLVLFCKNKNHRGAYQSLFDNKVHNHSKIQKIYHAIAPYRENMSFPIHIQLNLIRGEPFYVMKVSDGIPNSQTLIDIIAIKNNFAKYRLVPITGKLHQLRVHLNHLGIAIKNDPFYPNINHKKSDDFKNPLQLLAKSISFIDPIDGQAYFFESKRELFL